MKAICIDDEKLALDYMERQINKLHHVELIGSYLHPLEGKKHILSEEVDIVFLDIQLPEINGIELAEQIIQEKPDIIVVFITAYDTYAVKAFELNAIDYLVKPVSFDRLKKTMERIDKQILIEDEVKEKTDILHVKVGQYLAFEVEPGLFKPIPWRTAKTQELFIYLLQNNGTLVEKSTLMGLLWGVYEAEKGYSLLYTTVYNVRKALRAYSNHFVLHNHADGYLLELKNVEIDLVQWERELSRLPALSKSTVKQYEDVIKRNKHAYLSGHDYVWLEAERHRFEELWYTKVSKIANCYEANNDIENAIKWYTNLYERYPENEEAHFSLMKIYAQIGKYERVEHQYRMLNEVLQDELSIEPSSYIKKWYEKQMKEKLKRNGMNFTS